MKMFSSETKIIIKSIKWESNGNNENWINYKLIIVVALN